MFSSTKHFLRGASRAGIGGLICVLLAACAIGPRIVHTDVTAYNDWSTLPPDKTYTFARTLEFQNSLEVKSYEDIVRDELATRGFTLAPDAGQANLVVTLRPSVTGTRVRVRDPWFGDPFWPSGGFYGRRGFGYGPWSGWGLYGGYGSLGYYDDYSVDVFSKRLELDIDSRATAGKRYYEGRVESSGATDSMKGAVPVLVRALFSDFPGNNGQTRRVDVAIERK
jgi:hypothetical protein